MSLPLDPPLLDAGSDAVIRLKGHDSYGGEAGALKALKRRVPDSSAEDRLAVFDLFSRVYDRAVEAIDRHQVERPKKKGRFAQPGDIDFDACLAELDEYAPGEAIEQKVRILNWVIFWHYLK